MSTISGPAATATGRSKSTMRMISGLICTSLALFGPSALAATDVPETRHQQTLSLADPENPAATLEAARRSPGTLDNDEIIRLRGDVAAHLIRSADTMEDVPRRQATTDQAIAKLEGLLAELPQDGPATRRTRFDYILALRQRERMEDTLDQYQALLDDRIEPPPWVVEAAADARLYLREPDQAARLYRQLLAEDPDRFNTRVALFYALVESEDFDGALTVIDNLADDHRGSPRGREAAVVAAMGRAFANQLGDAQRRLETLVEENPDHLRMQQELSTVYRWRGWPHRALAVIEPVTAEAPEAVGPRLARAAVLADLQRFGEAEEQLEGLMADHPENRHVQRQHKQWQDRDRWHFQTSGEYGDSDGVSEFGTRDRAVSARLTAPWIGQHFQPWITARYTDARFPEGESEYDRIGVGASWRDRRRHAYLEIHRNRTGSAETGVTAGFDWHLGDHWSFATRYENLTEDVPLRARGQGVDGWKAEAAARWQAHESLGIRAGVSRLDISDGNVRWAGIVGSEHRLISQAHHLTTGHLDLYGSRASQEGGFYFNPTRDASLGYTLQHDWLTWRHYEQSLTQRFTIGGGGYWQEGFGTNPIGDLRYEHRWALSRTWRLTYGLGISSRVYDGDREQRVHGRFSLEGHF